MNSAQKIESFTSPSFRRRSDRLQALTQVVQRVEREHAGRLRRMTILLGVATVILLLNGLLVVSLG